MALSATILGTTFKVGDTISVDYKIIEKEVVSGKTKKEKHEEQKERTQAFAGMVIAIRGSGDGKSFVIRRMGAGGIGIERIIPFISPWIKRVTLQKRGRIHRAKLYYLRLKTNKEVGRIVGHELVEPPAKVVETKVKKESAVETPTPEVVPAKTDAPTQDQPQTEG